MYKLYARRWAGSMAVEAVLVVVGAQYEVEDLVRNADGSFAQAFHDINPRAEVPTLILPDDSVMSESAAILIHLADLFPEAGLSPPLHSPQRPRYLRWMVYLATTVYMSDLRLFYPERYTTDPVAIPGIKSFAAAGLQRELEIYSEALGRGPFMLGGTMSALDIYAAMLVSWVPDPRATMERHANLGAMYDGVLGHPAIARVFARNGVEF